MSKMINVKINTEPTGKRYVTAPYLSEALK